MMIQCDEEGEYSCGLRIAQTHEIWRIARRGNKAEDATLLCTKHYCKAVAATSRDIDGLRQFGRNVTGNAVKNFVEFTHGIDFDRRTPRNFCNHRRLPVRFRIERWSDRQRSTSDKPANTKLSSRRDARGDAAQLLRRQSKERIVGLLQRLVSRGRI